MKLLLGVQNRFSKVCENLAVLPSWATEQTLPRPGSDAIGDALGDRLLPSVSDDVDAEGGCLINAPLPR